MQFFDSASFAALVAIRIAFQLSPPRPMAGLGIPFVPIRQWQAPQISLTLSSTILLARGSASGDSIAGRCQYPIQAGAKSFVASSDVGYNFAFFTISAFTSACTPCLRNDDAARSARIKFQNEAATQIDHLTPSAPEAP